MAEHILTRMNTSRPFPDILHNLNGNFAVVIEEPDAVHLGVDAVRSIPLFYRQAGNKLLVSDDIRPLRRDDDTIDADSAIEYATAMYVTGPHTLFSEITGLQSGECVSWHSREKHPHAQRYYQYLCSYDADASVKELCEAFDAAVLNAFERTTETLQGRQVVVPLSGGLDSRLVASTFRRCGYDNVVCLSFGVPGNRESARSRAVAETLGYRWIQVPYSPDMWRDALNSTGIRDYWSFSANGVSVPHCDDWPAVRMLRQQTQISEDAIFVPGHTGDFICGSHLKYIFDPVWHDDPHAFNEAMIKKHYSTWDNLLTADYVRAAIHRRLQETLGHFPRDTDEDLARMYEYWEWQERQAKFILNALRVYEFFDFAWRIPLWNRAIVEFWRRVPVALKMDKFLYRTYLASYDPAGVFRDVAPKRRWSREQALQRRTQSTRIRMEKALQSIGGPFAALLQRYKKFEKHLREYRRHPLGLAHAYGALRHLFLNPGKRHAYALVLKEFLRHQYGVEISELRSEIR